MTVAMLPELALGTARLAHAIAPVPASDELIDALLSQTGLFLQFVVDCHDTLDTELNERCLHPDVLDRASQDSLETLARIDETRGTLTGRLLTEKQKREFQRQEETTAKVRRTFTEWVESGKRPFPPIDLKKLEKDARADIEAGRLIRVETFEDLFPSDSEEN